MRIIHRDAAGTVRELKDAGKVTELLADPAGLLWLDLARPQPDDFDFLSRTFGFHPLAIEDARKRSQRPKIEEYDHYFFMVIHGLKETAGKPFDLVELHFFVGPNYVVSLHEEDIPAYVELLDGAADSRVMRRGSDFLIYELVDMAVDSFFPVMDRVDEQIDALEDEILARPSQQVVNKLFGLKKQLVMLRKVTGPQREVVNALTRRDFVNIGEEASLYFRDVYDHLVRIYEMLDSYRDLLTGALDVYLSTVSNNLNNIMKRLTIFAALFMPITFLTGVFGMNFGFMPQVKYDNGSLFYIAVVVMIIIAVGNLYWFRWRKWM